MSLYDADTVDSRGTSEEHKGHLRLCWLTNGGDGYRAGRVNGRDNTRHWRKVIFYRSNGHVKPLPAFSARTLVLLGLPNVLSGAKAQRFSAEALAGGYDEDDEDDSDGDGDDDNDDDADDECVLVASACLTSVLRHVMDDAGESLVRTALLERKDSVGEAGSAATDSAKTALEHFGQRVGVSLTLRATHVHTAAQRLLEATPMLGLCAESHISEIRVLVSILSFVAARGCFRGPPRRSAL